ncbi:MAG: hypothetical protein ISR91_00575 [Candidatus Delongbacteria bacterium]|nr:hypothetical protein [Candidatus Delongbacteria bacterium]
MDWLFALTVAAGVFSAVCMFRVWRRLPERRYRQQAQQLADYVKREQLELQLSPRTSSAPPESEKFLAACYSIIEKGQ